MGFMSLPHSFCAPLYFDFKSSQLHNNDRFLCIKNVSFVGEPYASYLRLLER